MSPALSTGLFALGTDWNREPRADPLATTVSGSARGPACHDRQRAGDVRVTTACGRLQSGGDDRVCARDRAPEVATAADDLAGAGALDGSRACGTDVRQPDRHLARTRHRADSVVAAACGEAGRELVRRWADHAFQKSRVQVVES